MLRRDPDPVSVVNSTFTLIYGENFWHLLLAIGPLAVFFAYFCLASGLELGQLPTTLYISNFLVDLSVIWICVNLWLAVLGTRALKYVPVAKYLGGLRVSWYVWLYATVVVWSYFAFQQRGDQVALIYVTGFCLAALLLGRLLISLAFGLRYRRTPDLVIPQDTIELWRELNGTLGTKATVSPMANLTYGRGLMAYATTRSRVAVTPAFCRELSLEEQKFILLHELGHIRLGHIKMRSRNLSWIQLAFLEFMVLPYAVFPFAPAISVAVATFGALVSWLLYSWRSWTLMPTLREQEFQADAFAAQYAEPEVGMSALQKVQDSIAGELAAKLSVLTHPALRERLDRLAEIGAGRPPKLNEAP